MAVIFAGGGVGMSASPFWWLRSYRVRAWSQH